MRLRNALLPVLALGALALAGCGGTSSAGTTPAPQAVSAADLAKVTLKVGDQKGGSQALLEAAGLLNTPYKIEWSTFTSGPPLLEAASAGAVDLGGVGNTPPIFSAAANAKIAVVQAAQHTGPGDALLVPEDSPIRDAKELKGKTIAVAKGSSAHGQLLDVLIRAGLKVNDVTITFLQPADAYTAFTQHRVDAWAIWDPYTSQALLEAKARSLVDGSSGTANGYSFQVAGRSALGDAGKNTAIQDYLSRLAKAQKWSDSHKDEWAQAWSKVTGLKPEVARTSVGHGATLPIPLEDKVIASEQQLADAFSDAKVLPGKVKFADFVDTRYEDKTGGSR
ncbi:ABC transporter substrate-binding protein [Kutzneria viridogrisea]|uniref:Sulfonate transport system substrate-binding protein n=1 Tax=Kutzneria viridogrisea TaxID=47990 RepID=A0ABR6BRX1_9PSEU|nr:sulfonate transport system substrate-binding protein [Kutzneria viridogrisea]